MKDPTDEVDVDDLSIGETDTDLNISINENSESTGDDENAPEALVRTENKAVGIFRVVVILVLVAAATVTALLVYSFNSNAEQEAFVSEFDAVASKIVESMAADAALKFWMARTLANTVTLTMENTGDTALNLTLPPTRWEKITQEVRFNANSNFVAWGPILSSDEERLEFEAFAATEEFTVGANPVCYVCGSERKGYSNPDDLVELTGFGVFPCSQIENSGRQGIIPKENCEPVSAAVTGTCNCIDLPPEAEVLSNLLTIPDSIFAMDDETGGARNESWGQPLYHPIWQATVLEINEVPTMYNQYSDRPRRNAIKSMKETSMPVISEIIVREGSYYENYGGYVGETTSILYYPVYDPSDSEIVGSVTVELRWNTFMTGVFPPNSDLVDVVVENTCGQNYTYQINLEDNSFVLSGKGGDLHDSEFEHMMQSSTFEDYEEIVNFAAPVNKNQTGLDYCRYRFIVYPTQEMEAEYISNSPMIYAIVTAAIFIFTSFVFVLYDFIVRRRQSKVMASAKRTNAIVASLFPQNVRNRILERGNLESGKEKGKKKSSFLRSNMKTEIETFLCDEDKDSLFGTEPIADLFPHATVMFLDIAGFTAWCSEREPVQVFRLLETIYQAFDEIGHRLNVFKVETIGDSYVSVCGLPQPRKNHAVVMAQFARMCLTRMSKLTKELERYLGPSTGDLRARVGLHSGPVTAGVLRGEKARFQLFGDTVNTCARMESHGLPHRIHVSKETADLITAAGKGTWLEPRTDPVSIKGKGEVSTFWLNPKGRGSVGSTRSSSDKTPVDGLAVDRQLDQKTKRLVEWNVEVLYTLLEKVAASRAKGGKGSSSSSSKKVPKKLNAIEKAAAEKKMADGTIVIDEMVHILDIPGFDAKNAAESNRDKDVILPPEVKSQLQTFVSSIATMYRDDVPFHNFEHASHVIMSAYKLMKRIISPDDVDYSQDDVALAKEFHSRTYGIYSDALMQFTILFSCLIHDVDHTGLTNAELIKMNSPTATLYRNKSVAEQNSVDLAWDLLLSDSFQAVRAVIYTNEEELTHFRQLLVNAVMATDIADKELKSLRERRWDDAFSEFAVAASNNDKEERQTGHDIDNRKATIIYEYIIQASDIAHTMQHWHTYQKFNRRLFHERYLAWINGHAGEKDPSAFWYKGELWFFDNYIIPLAEKLNTCGVFGVSYHEFLTYAVENRKEWVKKGEDVTAEFLAECQAKYGTSSKIPSDV